MPSRLLTLAPAATLLAFAACGQTTLQTPLQASELAFEVTSVKPFAIHPPPPGQGPGPALGPTCPPNGHFVTRDMLQPVILWAYDIKFYQIAQVPEWAKQLASAWSIEATSPRPVALDQCRLMVQGLLADRFKLAVHREKREIPVQALIVAKGGSKIREANDDSGKGARINGRVESIGLDDRPTPDGWKIWDLVAALNIGASMRGENPIVDRTGLEGVYEFDLDFDQFPNQFLNAPYRKNLPDLPAALQQQLGLKLEERKERMDILVIDHVEKASPN